MQRLLALLALILGALALPGQAIAQDFTTTRTIATERWVEEWDEVSQQWVRVSDSPGEVIASGAITSVTTTHIVNGVVVDQTETELPSANKARFATPVTRPLSATSPSDFNAQYGPFRVLDGKRAAIVGSTDQSSPIWFDAMMRDFPGLEVIEMIEAPGTRHDIANLKVGRRIRAAGLRTHVPDGGSVRSGAVELYLAGTTRTMADGAQFAVHSWLDNYGRQPKDFPEDHPANRLYLDYYAEMGMSKVQARAFYSMTNSVPHERALWLTAKDMRPWVGEQGKAIAARIVLADAGEPLPQPVIDDAAIELPLQAFDVKIEPLTVELARPMPVIAYADLGGQMIDPTDATLLDSGAALP